MALRLNGEKCKAIHFEKSNSKEVDCMTGDAGNEREETNLERDGFVCWRRFEVE